MAGSLRRLPDSAILERHLSSMQEHFANGVQAVAAASKLHIMSGDAVTQQVPVFCQVSL